MQLIPLGCFCQGGGLLSNCREEEKFKDTWAIRQLFFFTWMEKAMFPAGSREGGCLVPVLGERILVGP